MCIESVMPSSHLILCRPLLLSSIFPSIRVFSNESTLMRWPKYWSSTQGSSPSEWTGWVSLQSKGLSRVFSNTTVQKHQFFSAQLSSQSNSHIHYMITGKIIALTRRTFVGKVMSLLFIYFFCIVLLYILATSSSFFFLDFFFYSFISHVFPILLFNMLSRLVITFLSRSKHLLISWLQSPSVVILESRKIKSDTVSTVSPSICHEVMGPDAMILVL